MHLRKGFLDNLKESIYNKNIDRMSSIASFNRIISRMRSHADVGHPKGAREMTPQMRDVS
jgi:hypothetical protein